MIKLGDTVRTIKDTRWYEDLGDSIGTVVAISNSGRKTRVVFDKKTFIGYDYFKLHSCSLEVDEFDYLEEYFGEEEDYEKYMELKEGYRGYVVNYKDLELAKIKKGNTNIFKEVR